MKNNFFATILFLLVAGLITRTNAQEAKRPELTAQIPNTTKAIPAKLDGDAAITNGPDKRVTYSYSRDNINWTESSIAADERQIIRGVKDQPTYFRIVTNGIAINYLISDKFYVILWNKDRQAWDLYEYVYKNKDKG